MSSEELENLAVSYYKRLYSMDDVPLEVEGLPRDGFERMTREEARALNKPFMASEVEEAVRSMGKYKAPRPDGYQPIFYQNCWEIVGDSVTRFVLEFFASGTIPPSLNDALVVLIAKVTKPERMNQFRPISLCNVLC